MPYNHLLALGSSFASGPGIEPQNSRAAGRSGRNYPTVLAELLGCKLTDRTASGATTSMIIDSPQRSKGETLPPQLENVPTGVDLVTITAAGNDVNYIGTMIKLAVAGRLSRNLLTRPLGALLRGNPSEISAADTNSQVSAALTRVIGAVQTKAPNARIVLVDYMSVIGQETQISDEAPFSVSELLALGEFAEKLSAGFSQAAEATGVDLVSMSEASRDHALGSNDPWVIGLPKRLSAVLRVPPFHPNATGMAAAANLVAASL